MNWHCKFFVCAIYWTLLHPLTGLRHLRQVFLFSFHYFSSPPVLSRSACILGHPLIRLWKLLVRNFQCEVCFWIYIMSGACFALWFSIFVTDVTKVGIHSFLRNWVLGSVCCIVVCLKVISGLQAKTCDGNF